MIRHSFRESVYAHGVSPETACLPKDWEKHCVTTTVATDDGVVTVVAPELHDLAFSKLVAGREKDIHYVQEMIRCDLIKAGRLKKRMDAEADVARQRLLLSAWERLRRMGEQRGVKVFPMLGLEVGKGLISRGK